MARRKSRRSAKSAKADHANVNHDKGVLGPSNNPLTNFFLADLIIRSASYVVREAIEKNMLKSRYGPQTAREIVRKKSFAQRTVALGLTTLATRSVPGALIVGGGALAKTLYDRRKDHRHSQHKGDTKLIKQAQSDD